ncbi:MAG: Nudix family hydrolase [Betaproteobacteria bacterium]
MSGELPSPEVDWVEVAAGVIEREDGAFLLAQRPVGKVYAGWWEFPGGKVETGEPIEVALARELHEELGIDVDIAYPWITRTHVYEHARVRLHFYRVVAWRGELQSKESQRLAWQRVPVLTVGPVLPANGPILKALELPLELGVTQTDGIGERAFLDRLDRALDRGLRFVQVREKNLSVEALDAFSREVVARVHHKGGRVVVNGAVEFASTVGADGVHFTAETLMRTAARPPTALAGASCHGVEDLARAVSLELDYVVLGPVRPTPTHQGAAGIGLGGFSRLAHALPIAVYAIGGLSLGDLPALRKAGAHGVAAIRGAWSGH